jgi:hypothetical protein
MGRRKLFFGTTAEYQMFRGNRLHAQKRCITCCAVNDLYPKRRCSVCASKVRIAGAEYRLALKQKVFEAYGGVFCACPSCEITDIRFLTLDHMPGNSWRNYPFRAGDKLYLWLVKHNFPPGFRVLCFNCNIASYSNKGTCPHLEDNREREVQRLSDAEDRTTEQLCPT